jgi:hypothetical protein
MLIFDISKSKHKLIMEASEFKNRIKELQDSLRGLTIQLITKYSRIPYTTLNSFGNAILEQEQYGYDFSIRKVWTNEGVIEINSFAHFVELLKTKTVDSFQVSAYEPINDYTDLMRSFGRLD